MHTHTVKKSPDRPSPAQLMRFFLQTLPHTALLSLPALQELTFYQRLFSPLVTLWYLLFQWLNHDSSLQAVLIDVQQGGADRLNPKLSRQLTGSSTGTYSDARTRLPEAFLTQALHLQGTKIANRSPITRWKDLIVSLLDGTTLRLRPHGDIPKEFGPHTNQHHKETYWCLMRTVVSFCCFSGAALDCAMGALRGSEQALGCQLILRALGRRLWLGDRNFGVFRIVQTARQVHQHVLLRMTAARAIRLRGSALRDGDFPLLWKPTRYDKLQPDCCPSPVPGRLIIQRLVRRGFRPQWLCLFTSLTDSAQYPAAELLELYSQRWHIELNLRYVKAQMRAAQLEVRSAAMARKQWTACLLAYNLIRAAMLCAALRHNLPPLTLSFSTCRRHLQAWLSDFGCTLVEVAGSWKNMLNRLGKCQLPRRRKPRPNEPRAKRHIRESFPPLVGSRARARRMLKKLTMKS